MRDGAINPGSAGHPDLCAKPCLHAVAGRCMNTEGCRLCWVRVGVRVWVRLGGGGARLWGRSVWLGQAVGKNGPEV